MRTSLVRTIVVLTTLVAACDSPSAPPEPVYEGLDASVRPLVERIVVDASAAAWYGARFSDGLAPPHLAFGGWLVARDEAYFVHVSLASTEEATYDPFCSADAPTDSEPPFWMEHDACSRLRVTADAYFVDMYFTEQPHRLPDDRHEMRYPTAIGPEGTVTYPDNPLITWRYDFNPDGSHDIEVSVDTEVVFEAFDGAAYSLTHTGIVRGSLDPTGSVVTTRTELAFPRLTSCEVPLEATVVDDGVTVQGRITCGDETVARITHPGDEFVFEWIEP